MNGKNLNDRDQAIISQLTELFEEFPLYKKQKSDVSATLGGLPKVNINMPCGTCESKQTFIMRGEYYEHIVVKNLSTKGALLDLKFVCAKCSSFQQNFNIQISPELDYVMKVGQFPAWDIQGDKNIEVLLGTHASYYRKGLICESQGFGIAAFAYYRRIVEEIIDSLLDQVRELLSSNEMASFDAALQKAKATRVTAEKIDLVKDLLPSILRPDGLNPLRALHQALSQGLHAESDDSCLKDAATIRKILIFLTLQIAATASAKKVFTEGMRGLLSKKS